MGVAAPVLVGKQILSASAAFGCSSVAVAAQEKEWLFSGLGLALGDEVKWVNSSASEDEHCNWQADTVQVDSSSNATSTAANITFSVNSESTGPLRLCYRFSAGDHPFKLYPAISLQVYELYDVVKAEEGSELLSVVGYPKVLTLSGFGNAESDKARWLLEGGESCASAEDIAPLTSGGDDGESNAIVSSKLKASFKFTEQIYSAGDHGAGNGSAIATLCYKFGSEDFQNYPAISMRVHHVIGWTSSVGGSSLAVAGVPEDLAFTGYGISEDLASGDRARWILAGTNCSRNAALMSDVSANPTQVTDSQATFTFATSMVGVTPCLCYWFQDEPPMMYTSLTINVALVSALSAPSFGDTDVAVAGYPKSWGFAGGHITDGDFVRWIYNDSSDCSDLSSIAQIDEDGEIVSGQTTCTFAEHLSGRWITPCYR